MFKKKTEWFVVPKGGGATNEAIAKELGQAGIGCEAEIEFEGKLLKGYVLPEEVGHSFITSLKKLATSEGPANFASFEKVGDKIRPYRLDDLKKKSARRRLQSKIVRGSDL